jgi:acetoin utilization deacetylase AcuC-like enzyme
LNKQLTVPVFYTPGMSAMTNSFSPSAEKPRRVVRDWQERNLPITIVRPRERLPRRAHDQKYVLGVIEGRIDNGFGNRDRAVASTLALTCGSVFAATAHVIDTGHNACAPVSGFHHARFDRAAAYCTFNGLAEAAAWAAHEGYKVGIIDCDYHYGDGTDEILGRLPRSLSQNIMHWSSGGHGFLRPSAAQRLLDELPLVVARMADFGCEAVIYQAGADMHVDDPLGGLLTSEQMARRDHIVFSELAKRNIGCAWTLAGGYQEWQILMRLHRQTMLAAVRHYCDIGEKWWEVLHEQSLA